MVTDVPVLCTERGSDKRTGETSAGAQASSAKAGSTPLNSTDPFYKEFRDLPYHVAVQRLQRYARDARREYTDLGNKDLSELKTFVKGLPKLMMLERLSDVATPVAEQVRAGRPDQRCRRYTARSSSPFPGSQQLVSDGYGDSGV